MIRLLFIAVGYCFGCIQTSFFYGKKQGLDIREHGSGNAGSTNALRVMGKKAGIIVFIGDMGKLILAVLLMLLLFKSRGPEYVLLIKLYTGLGVVLGHDFPFYMDFKGGKGVASTAALIILLDWRMAIVGLALFFGIALLNGIVSLASCVTLTSELILFTVLVLTGKLACGIMPVWEALLVFAFIVALSLLRHTENIKRLFRGEEKPLKIK
ncbi:MAG: glycerol-3-phosphate 1-O-acyltransferase PlsY [Lachnospiraceae bacterium]|nr:glycerol-3-phosphate 1-O-acyltransferase PlsY [Lachnospiraceae bacterium]